MSGVNWAELEVFLADQPGSSVGSPDSEAGHPRPQGNAHRYSPSRRALLVRVGPPEPRVGPLGSQRQWRYEKVDADH